MEQYNVTGMSCAACSSRVEKAVSALDGVTSCSVNLLTGSMGVEGTAASETIIRAVEQAGYGASLKGASKAQMQKEDELVDKETPVLKRRLIASLGFLVVLMYFSMGHMMWGWPVPAFFQQNVVAQGILQMVLAVIVMVINQKFFINGFKGLLKKAPNMDTLVALGSMASFLYSVVALMMLSEGQRLGNAEMMHQWMHEFYFESAAMILALITVGKMLEARSKGKTTDALKGLMKLAPKTAVLLVNGAEKTVQIEQVKKGDVFVVKPGESIPVDGVVLDGHSAVNESALTGESIPVDKDKGDAVSAATINQSGYLKCEATRVGEDTTLSQIIQMVFDAAATKAPIAKVADTVSGIFVPMVMSIALITTVIWMIVGESFGFALARGISVLVISCPCALGLATPVAIMVGSGMGAKHGILFKTAVSLEETGKADVIALDKTGTITSGEPVVTDVICAESVSEEELIALAGSLETKSEHPLAKAIMKKVNESQISLDEISEFEVLPGNGLKGMIQSELCCAGNLKFVEKFCTVSNTMKKQAEKLSDEGKTPLYFVRNGMLAGVIAVADAIKSDSKEAIVQMKNMGCHVVMLTGDNEKTAKAIGKLAGVDEVIAGVLPSGKEAVIRRLQKKGKVIMVGDGINDAPALTRADIGVAIGAGTDVAIDAADVVLMRSTLMDVPAALRLSRSVLKNIHENLFWAFFYNSVGIPLAAGLFISTLGWKLNPMFGAAAMSLSSFCVVSNALRLNFFKMHDASKDKPKRHKKQKEVKSMEKTMKIEGMMCMHCENRVKKTLEKIEGVESAVVSHEKGTAVVTLNAEVANDVLKNAVEAQDYTVISVE